MFLANKKILNTTVTNLVSRICSSTASPQLPHSVYLYQISDDLPKSSHIAQRLLSFPSVSLITEYFSLNSVYFAFLSACLVFHFFLPFLFFFFIKQQLNRGQGWVSECCFLFHFIFFCAEGTGQSIENLKMLSGC